MPEKTKRTVFIEPDLKSKSYEELLELKARRNFSFDSSGLEGEIDLREKMLQIEAMKRSEDRAIRAEKRAFRSNLITAIAALVSAVVALTALFFRISNQ